jgi:flagellar protein FliS
MYAEYDEHEVLERDPIELVCLLYGKAIEKLSLARTLAGDEQIRERNTAIARASEIVIELQSSLDAEKGGEIALNLARLYEYVQQRLATGLAERSDEALAEAGQLLETLAEGWKDAAADLKSPPAAEPETAGAGRTWTV